jgi:hypothetical protein
MAENICIYTTHLADIVHRDRNADEGSYCDEKLADGEDNPVKLML